MASTPLLSERNLATPLAREIRVAWLFPSLARGYYWQPVFKEFTARIPQTRIFTSIWPGFAPGLEGSFEVQTLLGLRYVDVKKQVQDSRRGFIWAPLSIVKKLAAFRPDLLFCSGFSGWTVCALLFKLLRGSRVMIYWEGCSAQSVGKSKLKLLGRRLIARFADAAVSNGEEGAAYLRDGIGMPKNKVLCHPCQVPDVPLLRSSGSEVALPDVKHPVFLYVGSISARKGWNYLLDAAHILVKRGINSFSVLFVGSGEQETDLRAAIADRRVEHVAQQIGAVPYHQLGPYYAAADVFVSPTRADTWGVAVLEAMAFGKPVLCSKFAGTRQMLTHGQNGFVFDPFNANELADYMERFIQQDDLIREFGAHSRETIAPFTPARAAEMLANLAAATVQRQAITHPQTSHDRAKTRPVQSTQA